MIRKFSPELGVEPRTSHILKLCTMIEHPHLLQSQALLHHRSCMGGRSERLSQLSAFSESQHSRLAGLEISTFSFQPPGLSPTCTKEDVSYRLGSVQHPWSRSISAEASGSTSLIYQLSLQVKFLRGKWPRIPTM